MDLQHLAVTLLVPACAVYAAWKVAPAAMKRGAARRLLGRPLPAPLTRVLQRAARNDGGCGCDGCDAAAPKPVTVPVTIHRRRR